MYNVRGPTRIMISLLKGSKHLVSHKTRATRAHDVYGAKCWF